MITKTLLTISGLAILLAANSGVAVEEYVSLIPNGSVNSCLTCHVNADPNNASTARNSFGNGWRNNTPSRTYNSLLAGKDSDGDTFSNGVELGDPAGTWTPGSPDPSGPVFNPGDATSHPTASTAPKITSAPPTATGTVGVAYNFTVIATGTAPITFSASGLPTGLAIAPTTGVISGTPTTASTFNGTITAANGTLPNATQAFTIVIGAASVAPTITSAPPTATGTVGVAYNFTVTATGTAPITFSASGLPTGLAIVPTTGIISGTPTTASTFNGTITAANGTLPNATQAFTLVIGTAPLLSIFNTTTNTVAVFWPSPSTGWILEENTTGVSSTNWSNVTTTIQDDGTTKTLIVDPPAGNRFYRLKQ